VVFQKGGRKREAGT